MAQESALTPELGHVLSRYLAIQQEERRLAEEKRSLQDVLMRHMHGMGRDFWYPVVGGQDLKVRYTATPQVRYDEERLRQRLGDRYVHILGPDPRKLRAHLAEIEPLLEPMLPVIGSPTPDKVRSAIASGIVAKEEFQGAFEKSVKRTLIVSRAKPLDTEDIP